MGGGERDVSRLDTEGDHDWADVLNPRGQISSQQRCAKCGLWRTPESELRSCPPPDDEEAP